MLCITFDNFGCGSGPFPACPFPDVVPTVEWERYNEIGLSLGHPRILNLLRQLGIRTTYFCEGYSAVLHPTEMKRWHEDGHEIALHGWKHEMWALLPTREKEDELIGLSVAAVKDVLGVSPIGFRPPGLQINQWTDDVMEHHGIRYIAHSTRRVDNSRFASVGVKRPDPTSKLYQTRLGFLDCKPELIDGDLIAPAWGGLFGTMDSLSAYERFVDMAIEHERSNPDLTWVFIVHPFISGNRGWHGFEFFLRRLHSEVGSACFRTARDAVMSPEGEGGR